MTRTEADALLDAFLAAKAAGQEELWRASHPEAPDGPTVLIVWLMSNRSIIRYKRSVVALEAVDVRCALRMAIYAAIMAHPICGRFQYRLFTNRYPALLAAIRAAIACYRDPTDDNRRAAEAAAEDAAWAAAVAEADASTWPAAVAADAVVSAVNAARKSISDSRWAINIVALAAVNAVRNTSVALGNLEMVIDAIIAAIVDHYEDRPLEMP